jgi:hypothetical protein
VLRCAKLCYNVVTVFETVNNFESPLGKPFLVHWVELAAFSFTNMEPTTRAEAKAKGLKQYFTGKPCPHGHVAERYTSSSGCITCCATHRDEYYKANPEKKAEYYKANTEKLAAYAAAYRRANPHIRTALHAKRRATKLNATPAWADLEAIKKIYSDCAFITQATGVQQHVDHIVPLQGKTVCGLHVHYNLQIIDASDNRHKSNRLLPTVETI